MTQPSDLQTQLSVQTWTNGQRQITGAYVLGLFTLLLSILGGMGTWTNGVYSANITGASIISALGFGPPAHVQNAGVLAYLTTYGQSVVRDDVGVIYNDTGASCADADGYAQVQPATGHCWQVVGGTRLSPRIWGATGGPDDSNAWNAAFAYLGNLGGAQKLYDDFQNTTIASPIQVTIPSNVTLDCGGTFEGGDGTTSTTLPTINFTGATGGFYLKDQAAITGCHVYGSSPSIDHVIEYAGKIDLDHVRVTAPINGILVTHNLTVGLGSFDAITSSSAPYINAGSGLTNGTYTKVPFTEAQGSGATATIVVAGGSITSATLDGSGTGYIPYACANLPQGALYSATSTSTASPQINCFDYTNTANTGRSRFNRVYIVGTTYIGLEIDDTYDFPVADDPECWNIPPPPPAPNTPPNSKCIRVGKADGLVINHEMAWNQNWAVYGDGPPNMYPQYTSVVSSVFDHDTNGVFFSSAQKNLIVDDNICRATAGICENIDGPNIWATISGNNDYCYVNSCTFIDFFRQVTIAGNSYHRDNASAFPFVAIEPDSAQANPSVFAIGSNTFDPSGNGPGIAWNAVAGIGTIGWNGWVPGGQYPYIEGTGASVSIAQARNARGQSTTDANGRFTIAHGEGYAVQQPSVSLIGASLGYTASIYAVDATNITVQVTTASGAAAPAGVTVNYAWGG